MSRKIVLAVVSLLFCSSLAAADDIAEHRRCRYCSMDRDTWNFSRVYIRYDNGSTEGTCSIHCAAMDMALNMDTFPREILVADFGTKELTDAESATWVIGGVKPGVMTKRAKWAFARREDAEAFVVENGGAVATFDEVMAAAYHDMHEDTKAIRARRAARRKVLAEEKAAGAALVK